VPISPGTLSLQGLHYNHSTRNKTWDFHVFTSVLLKIEAFWDVVPCRTDKVTDVLNYLSAFVFRVEYPSSFETLVTTYVHVFEWKHLVGCINIEVTDIKLRLRMVGEELIPWCRFTCIFQDVIDEYVERMKRRGPMYKAIDPTYLKWTPFVAPAATGPTWYSENSVEVSREEGKNQLSVKTLWTCCLTERWRTLQVCDAKMCGKTRLAWIYKKSFHCVSVTRGQTGCWRKMGYRPFWQSKVQSTCGSCMNCVHRDASQVLAAAMLWNYSHAENFTILVTSGPETEGRILSIALWNGSHPRSRWYT